MTPPQSDAYADLAAYTALPRLTSLALSPDGSRLVAVRQQPDAKGASYVSALWEIPLDGGAPVRLTRSDEGESSPAFLPDGTLLFTSSRPDPAEDDAADGAALWALGPSGEPWVVTRHPGGLGGPVVASSAGTVLASGSRLAYTTPHGDDAARRKVRKDRGITAILHTGMPIRLWDHELGDRSPRVLRLDPVAGEHVDLAPEASTELEAAAYSITSDGATAVTSWRRRAPRGRRLDCYALVDLASGQHTVRTAPDGHEYAGARIAPDGSRVAVTLERQATFEAPPRVTLQLHTLDGAATDVALGDLMPTEWVWSPDSSTLFVSGDLHGRGGLVVVDAESAEVRELSSDAVHSSLCPSPDGSLYALRTTMTEAPFPVRIDTASGEATPLSTPAPTPPLPGQVEEFWVDVDGTPVHSWLFLPAGAGHEPVPVMQWIHGGPFASYNAWSWRWNPWVAVAHGWAVVLPDPAMSTGYGDGCLERAWPYRADVVWREVEGVLDHVLARPDTDAARVALLGASFGGYMTNWIAGHTDRFAAIVTHAGLWALDQQHATTDAADFKTGIFGRLADHPDWYAQYSPHNSGENITSPMLVVHGNRDYRVPISEALRLWWDLVERWAGDPTTLPHRFLQLTGENHWVLSPANAEIWYDVVLGFCAQHVLGRHWTPTDLL
ncbi:S9 family peptidase [Jatrophihabitans fulvus]